jgi:chromosome partitioning protein
METISIVNHKGGVGKTTTALNFGAELASRGYSVLLVDFDAQGNLTTASGICQDRSIDDLKSTVSTALDKIMENEDEEGLLRCVVEPPVYQIDYNGKLDIVPCNIRMANTALKLNFMVARETYLKRLLEPVKESGVYDFCIIDNAPSIGVDFQNALTASDKILIVLKPDTFSTDGMRGLYKGYMKVCRHYNPDLKIAGALINDYDTRTGFSREMSSLIRSAWENIYIFDVVIPRSVSVAKSLAMYQCVRIFDPGNPVGIAYVRFTDEYLEKEAR